MPCTYLMINAPDLTINVSTLNGLPERTFVDGARILVRNWSGYMGKTIYLGALDGHNIRCNNKEDFQWITAVLSKYVAKYCKEYKIVSTLM